jgi:serine/threonine protein kinase
MGRGRAFDRLIAPDSFGHRACGSRKNGCANRPSRPATQPVSPSTESSPTALDVRVRPVQGTQGGGKIPRNVSHYRLGELLGSGAMGAVYKGIDRRDRSEVAVKLLNPDLATDKSFVDRFEREAHLGSLLRSPYTVQLLGYGSAEGHFFLAMEFAEGETLAKALAGGPLETSRALRIGVQVARALEEAQARGVVHRDIKPDNIILQPGDRVKVLDFGIARGFSGGTL